MELIVAVDKNWGIGKGNDLLCHLPGDLKHVKELTMGHTLILGKENARSRFPAEIRSPEGATSFSLSPTSDRQARDRGSQR